MKFSDVSSGRQSCRQRTGNAYTLILESSIARIEDDLAEGEHALELPLNLFLKAVSDWLNTIEA